MTHKELVKKALAKPGVQEEYDKFQLEFEILDQMLATRKKAGLTQSQIAAKMGTKQTAITRLESALVNGTQSPSLSTLRKYAEAVNCHLEIKLVRN